MAPIEVTRRYYHDSYTTTFESTVIETIDHDGHPAAILAETFFYPTSGGQPHDTGRLSSAKVVDVVVRESDGAIIHVLSEAIPAGAVSGTIDWRRRRDHMEQHTGQHLLSQAFIQLASAPTIGFHLGAEYVSIDLDTSPLGEGEVGKAVELANQIIERDVPIKAWFPTEAELATITLRKTPDVEGALRIVAIGDFDVSACGGTHVARTGEVGLIHGIRSEKLKRGMRISFLCGGRARADYAEKQRIVARVSAALTCGIGEIPDAVGRLQQELESTRRELSRHQEAALDREAAELRATGNGQPIIVRQSWGDRPVGDLKGLAMRLTSEPGTIALLGASGARTQFVFARSEDVGADLKGALDRALAVIGGGKGGGARIVQGGGGPSDAATVDRALAAAMTGLPGTG